jgi:hypothetical protein
MSVVDQPARDASAMSRHVASTVFDVVREGGDFQAVLQKLLALDKPCRIDRTVLREAAQVSRSEAVLDLCDSVWSTTAVRIELAVRTQLFD